MDHWDHWSDPILGQYWQVWYPKLLLISFFILTRLHSDNLLITVLLLEGLKGSSEQAYGIKLLSKLSLYISYQLWQLLSLLELPFFLEDGNEDKSN